MDRQTIRHVLILITATLSLTLAVPVTVTAGPDPGSPGHLVLASKEQRKQDAQARKDAREAEKAARKCVATSTGEAPAGSAITYHFRPAAPPNEHYFYPDVTITGLNPGDPYTFTARNTTLNMPELDLIDIRFVAPPSGTYSFTFPTSGSAGMHMETVVYDCSGALILSATATIQPPT